MGRFKEGMIDMNSDDELDFGEFPTTYDVNKMQAEAATSELKEIEKDLYRIVDRRKYYDEPIVLEDVERVIRSLQQAMRILE